MAEMKEGIQAIGIIGGSGLYQMEELRDATEHTIDTPFGSPSDTLVGGKLSGRQVYFLPRHGRGHRILPHEINYRANIYALRSLNVRWIISVAAVGSLQEKYAPRDVVLPSQFYDRTSQRAIHTFFGNGIAAHVAFAEPISANLRNLLAESARSLGVTVHNGGTYVNMDVIPRIPPEPNWPEHFALDTALVTDRKLWPQATVEKLKPILRRFLPATR